jgi:hypothetical protein
MIDKETKEKWVAALRSGEYQQGYHFLRTPSGEKYCCFGVLCDILELGWTKKEDSGYWSCETMVGWPPDSITSKIHNSLIEHLVKMNDSLSSFSEIALYIEKTL